jgi:2-C-methyl-D-erythritol 4-phosphate cytidylyltransferase
LKEVRADGTVVDTPPRDRFQRAQTPQGFPFQGLREAYRRASSDGFTGTDDAAVAERSGMVVRMVAGDPVNLKVTTPVDFALAEVLARSSPHES